MAFGNEVIDGGRLLLYIDGEVVGCAQTHSIEVTNATREVSCKGSGDWTSSEYGRHSWTSTVDALFNLYDEAGVSRYPDIYAAFVNKQFVQIKSEFDNGTGDVFTQEGEAVITGLTQNAGDSENTSFTVSFQGRGELLLAGYNSHYLTINAVGAEYAIIAELSKVVEISSDTGVVLVPETASGYRVTAYDSVAGTIGTEFTNAILGDTNVTVTLA